MPLSGHGGVRGIPGPGRLVLSTCDDTPILVIVDQLTIGAQNAQPQAAGLSASSEPERRA